MVEKSSGRRSSPWMKARFWSVCWSVYVKCMRLWSAPHKPDFWSVLLFVFATPFKLAMMRQLWGTSHLFLILTNQRNLLVPIHNTDIGNVAIMPLVSLSVGEKKNTIKSDKEGVLHSSVGWYSTQIRGRGESENGRRYFSFLMCTFNISAVLASVAQKETK